MNYRSRTIDHVLELQTHDWTEAGEMLSNDDIALLRMPLDQVSGRRNARRGFFGSFDTEDVRLEQIAA